MTTAEFVAKTFQETNFDTPTRYIWSHIKRHPLYGFLMFLGAFINALFASLLFILIGSAPSGGVMDFSIPAELAEELKDFDGFLKREVSPSLPIWNREGVVPRSFFQLMGGAGWFGYRWHDECGHSGRSRPASRRSGSPGSA